MAQAQVPNSFFFTPFFADPDPPVSYDLNFIDKSNDKMKKSNQTNVFTLTTQSTSPAGDEESIAKVLDWFSRSTDRSDWQNKAGGQEVRRASDQNVVVSKSRSEDSFLNDGPRASELLQKKIDDANALRAAHRSASTEALEIEQPPQPQQQKQQVYVPHLRSVWERHKLGPKVLIIKSMMSKNKGPASSHLSADRVEGNRADMTSERYSWEGPYKGDRQQRGVTGPLADAEYTSRSCRSQEALNSSARKYRNFSDLARAQVADQRGSDAGRHRQGMRIQPGLRVETENLSKSSPRLNRNYQSTEILLQDEPSRAPMASADSRTTYSPGSYSSPYKDVSWKNEDKRVQPSASPTDADVTYTVRGYSPHTNVQVADQESSADRIKQLKSFWEQARKPMYDGNVIRGPRQSKVSKRFTKSEYDLTSLGNNDESEANHPQAESPNLSASRTQFNNLRDFWDEATSGRPKSTVRTQLAVQDSKLKQPGLHSKTGSVATNTSPSIQERSTFEYSRDVSQHAPLGKENRPHRSRKDSSRADSMRRAASMFALTPMDENDEVQKDTGPSHVMPSRKLWQKVQKSITTRKPSAETETPTPLARAYIPRDYRHYLGATDEASFHGSLAPGPGDKEQRGRYRYELDEPVQASTPMSSEAWHSQKSAKMSQRPARANYSSDTGPDSSLSSTSDSWSNSKKNSNREHSISIIFGIMQ